MFKIEIITTDSNRNMIEKDILYTDNEAKAQEYVNDIINIETKNQFVFIEETTEATKVQIDIPDFYMGNSKNGGNEALDIGRILETEYISQAINDYINSED